MLGAAFAALTYTRQHFFVAALFSAATKAQADFVGAGRSKPPRCVVSVFSVN